MGYIDKVLGIKSAKALEKYIKTITAKDIIVIKTADHLKVIWSLGDVLHTYDIKAHVIYVVEEQVVYDCTQHILEATNTYYSEKDLTK